MTMTRSLSTVGIGTGIHDLFVGDAKIEHAIDCPNIAPPATMRWLPGYTDDEYTTLYLTMPIMYTRRRVQCRGCGGVVFVEGYVRRARSWLGSWRARRACEQRTNSALARYARRAARRQRYASR